MEMKTSNNQNKIKYSVCLPNDNKGESGIYRHPKSKDGLLSIPDNLNSLLKIFEMRVGRNHGRNKFSRNRVNENETTDNNESFTYENMKSVALKYMDFLVKNKCIEPITLDSKSWKFVGIYAKNCPEWAMAYIGHWYNDVTTVSIFDTLGLDGIAHILQLTKLTTLVLNGCFLDKIIKLKDEERSSNVKNLIIIPDKTGSYKAITEKYASYVEQLNFFDMEKIINDTLFMEETIEINMDDDDIFGESEQSIQNRFTPCSADSIALISFTSGSTGVPKGALISHKGLALSGYSFIESDDLQAVEYQERYFSYLPYAHVIEQMFFVVTLLKGMNTYYSSGDIKNIVEDINRANPTFFIAVPRILLRFYDVILGIFNSKSGIEKQLIDLAFKEKLNNIRNDNNYKHFLFDPLIFDKIRVKL